MTGHHSRQEAAQVYTVVVSLHYHQQYWVPTQSCYSFHQQSKGTHHVHAGSDDHTCTVAIYQVQSYISLLLLSADPPTPTGPHPLPRLVLTVCSVLRTVWQSGLSQPVGTSVGTCAGTQGAAWLSLITQVSSYITLVYYLYMYLKSSVSEFFIIFSNVYL